MPDFETARPHEQAKAGAARRLFGPGAVSALVVIGLLGGGLIYYLKTEQAKLTARDRFLECVSVAMENDHRRAVAPNRVAAEERCQHLLQGR